MTIHINEQQRRGGSAVFAVKERSAAVFEVKEGTAAGYKGAERRRRHRRGHADRRLEMRFEPDKVDRRVRTGRRADDKDIKFW